jgi:hypothetical protein
VSTRAKPLMGATLKSLAAPIVSRILAAAFLASSVQHWSAFLGGPAVEPFQTMPIHAQIATIVFAVTKPFVAVGLWMLASWGVILWVLVASAEIVLHLVYGPLFFDPLGVTLFHGSTFVLFLAVLWFTRDTPSDPY